MKQVGQNDAPVVPFELALADGSATLEFVLEAGGMMNRLALSAEGRQVEVVAGIDPGEAVRANPQYRGVNLFPFPNRLADAAYEFAGRHYQLPVNEQETGNALHGFLYRMQPEVLESQRSEDQATLSLLYRYDGALPGYPFRADVRIDYLLQRDALTLRMTATNRSDEAMPVGVGWHPYLCLDHELVDQLSLQMPLSERHLVDERMLPTGETVVYDEFAALKPIGDTRFDDCFFIKQKRGKANVTLWSDQSELGLDMWQDIDSGLNYLQLCIPPDRRSIAIEPMSCGINAFNTGRDVEVLQPGQEFTCVFGVKLITRKP